MDRAKPVLDGQAQEVKRTYTPVEGGMKLKGILDARLPISPRSRSLPSGVLQDFDPGLEPTVNDHLSLMIAISDNTATEGRLLVSAPGGRRYIIRRSAG